MALFRAPARRRDIGPLQDLFLVCAVVMILVIRLQLWATNYPQLGGGGLHIAHLLWGGLGMMIAIGLLISFLGKRARKTAAVIGGLGFGFFIDELGKFITEDNNYFFKPAAGLIYVIFIVLFLVTRQLQRRRTLTHREKVANAIDLLEEAAFGDLDRDEKREAIALLDQADQSDPLVPRLRALLAELAALPPRPVSRAGRAVRWARRHYEDLRAQPWFARALVWLFVLYGAVGVLEVFSLVLNAEEAITDGAIAHALGDAESTFGRLNFVGWANLVSSVVAVAFVWMGLLRLRRDRLKAFRWFERSLLVSILVTQVFVFVESQFAAVFGLAVDLTLLAAIRYLIAGETRLVRRQELDAAPEPLPAGGAAVSEEPAAV